MGWALVALVIAPLASCVTPARYGGPLAVRNQHPAQLTVLRLEPTTATTEKAGHARADVSISYSSLFLRGQSFNDRFVMDGEIMRTNLGARYGLTDDVQLDFILPVGHTTGGFLDHFVEEWHEMLNTPYSGRDLVFDNAYEITSTRNGLTVYEVDERALELMDIPLGVTWQLRRPTEQNPMGYAVRAGVELPTGDDERGFGNGGLDVSLGVVGEIWLGPIALTGHLDYTWAHTPNRAKNAGVDFGNVLSAGVGLEGFLTAETSVLVMVEWDESVLRNLDDVNTDENQQMLWIGFRNHWSDRLDVELGFGEDLSRDGPPDFTAFLGFRYAIRPEN